jgi:hypothetical protein
MKTKICKSCKITKLVSEFYQQSDKRYYNPDCKECCRLKSKHPLTLYKESIPEGFKLCSYCCQIKLLDEFHNDKKDKTGKSSYCKECMKQKNLLWLNKNKQKYLIYQQDNKFKTRYGISLIDYNNLLKKQNGVCAICNQKEMSTNCKGKIRNLSIDHCHKTNKVRGLLCARCNQGLGLFQDNNIILKKATEYLEKR